MTVQSEVMRAAPDMAANPRPWRVVMGGIELGIDLSSRPELDQQVRGFLTADVQRPLGSTPVNAWLTATDDPAPPVPDELDDGEEIRASWGLDLLWAETPAGVLSADGPHYRLHDCPDAEDDPFVVSTTFLTHAAARAGWNYLHSALLHTPAGAILLIGQSGRGKSTTSGIALGLGWQVESDDLTFLRRSGGTILALGLPRALSVPDEAVPAHLRPHASAEADFRNRRRLADLERSGDWMPLVGVVEVDHGVEAATRIEDLGLLDLVQGLMRNQAVAGSLPGQDHELAEIVAALGGLPRYRLALGCDAESRCVTTSEALQGLTSRRLGSELSS